MDAAVGKTRVHRALPRRELRRVGPFVFLDHFGGAGEEQVPMDVPPHPHMGLQTVTYLLSGRVRHRDSLGSDQVIVAGDVNWMTSGHGIVHAELSQEGNEPLVGVQTWVALPHAERDRAPGFHHVARASLPVHRATGVEVRAIAGALFDQPSPAPVYSAVTYLDVSLARGASITLPVDAEHELALYTLVGDARVDQPIPLRTLAHLGAGDSLAIIAGDADTRLLVLGGAPMPEPTVIWWNFIVGSVEEGRARQLDWEEGRYFPRM